MKTTSDSANPGYTIDPSALANANSTTCTVMYTTGYATVTLDDTYPKPSMNKQNIDRALEDWDRYNALDEQQKHMARPPPSLDRLVADRLAGDECEYWNFPIMSSTTWTSEFDEGRSINVYNELRRRDTKRCFEAEMATRRAQAMRSRSQARLGRRRGGFRFSKAYSPKRSWMQGRPRR